MFPSTIKTFDDAINPLIFLNWHTGMGMFRQPNQNNTVYFFMILWTVFISSSNLFAIYFAFSFIAQASKYHDASPLALLMHNILLCANMCITVIGPFLVWLRRKWLRDSLRKMKIMDDNFQAILGARNGYRKEYIRLTYHVIIVYMAVGMIAIYDIIWSLERSQSLLTSIGISAILHHPIVVMLAMNLNFRTFVGYLGKKFRDLNDALLRLAETPKPDSYPGERPSEIYQNLQRRITRRNKINNIETESLINNKNYMLHEIRKAHLELCKLSRQMNSVFGIQNLLSSAISFGMITGLLYTIYSAFIWERVADTMFKEIVPSTMWATIYIFQTWIISHSCWSVSYEAQRTGEVIYELLKLKVSNEIESDQIQLFALQMLQNPVRFDACSFFMLDYTFIQGIIGSITTYLIILIQMRHLYEPIKSNLFINATEI